MRTMEEAIFDCLTAAEAAIRAGEDKIALRQIAEAKQLLEEGAPD